MTQHASEATPRSRTPVGFSKYHGLVMFGFPFREKACHSQVGIEWQPDEHFFRRKEVSGSKRRHERHAEHDISWARIAMFGLCFFRHEIPWMHFLHFVFELGRAIVEERCHNKHGHIANSLGWKWRVPSGNSWISAPQINLPLGTSFNFSVQLNGFCCQCFHCSIRVII